MTSQPTLVELAELGDFSIRHLSCAFRKSNNTYGKKQTIPIECEIDNFDAQMKTTDPEYIRST